MIASGVTGRRGVARVSVWVDGAGSLRAIELLRIAVGPLTIAHLWPFLGDAVRGVVYSDRFYQPYFAWYPEVPGDVYVGLLWLAVGAATAVSFGVATRWTAAYTAGFVAYNLFLSRTYFWHNRAFLLVLLVGVAVLPLGRWWSVDAALRARSGDDIDRSDKPLWPILLMRFEVVVVFLASGWSKLVDPDWWGGTVTQLRVVRWRHVAAASGVPDGVLDMLATEGFHVWFAKVRGIDRIGDRCRSALPADAYGGDMDRGDFPHLDRDRCVCAGFLVCCSGCSRHLDHTFRRRSDGHPPRPVGLIAVHVVRCATLRLDRQIPARARRSSRAGRHTHRSRWDCNVRCGSDQGHLEPDPDDVHGRGSTQPIRHPHRVGLGASPFAGHGPTAELTPDADRVPVCSNLQCPRSRFRSRFEM